MKYILIIFSLIVFCSCISCNSNSPKTDSDSIIDEDSLNEEDIDTSDESEDVELDNSNDEDGDADSDLDSDETPDSDYPKPTCIEIYEGDPESKLCFGPVKTDVKCNGSPEDNEFVTVLEDDNPIGSTSDPMDINDDFLFFPITNKEGVANIYGCNRKDGWLYKIVISDNDHSYFTVDGHLIIFVIWDVSRDYVENVKLLSGNLMTNEIKSVKDWGSYGKLQLKFPFLTYNSFDIPQIINLETNESKKLSRLTGPFP
ncbi:MAG TPA: hypothetical protein PLZ43_03860, partial [bacterium]|nr:hypothetical protein [bacterium]